MVLSFNRPVQKILSLCILPLLLVSHSFAGLEWEANSQTVEVHPLQASVLVAFPFTNTGSAPVEIRELKPSCGCISGTVEKKIYKPGEAGIIEVEFDLRMREGAQRKGLEVKVDGGKAAKRFISTKIQPSFKLAAKRVVWESGEERAPKSLKVINLQQTPFRIKEVVPKREGVAVELVSKREGFEYELLITPDPELKNTMIPITVVPDTPEGLDEVKTFTAYVLLK
jgi:hypothetical protein